MCKKFLLVVSALSVLSINAFGETSQTNTIQKNVTPSARTCSDLNGAYVTGDFIYWKARQEELFYVAKLTYDESTSVINEQLSPKEIDFEYDPGFKLGLGGDLPFDGWDLYLNWTHFHTHPTSSTSSTDANLVGLFANIIDLSVSLLGREASASWNLMFNSLDFDWGRRFYLSETLTMRPSFGVKTAWIHQRFRFKLDDVVERSSGAPLSREFFNLKNHFWGIGPYAAINSKWVFIAGLGIYGELSGALLWGEFDQDLDLLRNAFDEVTQTIIPIRSQLSMESRRVRPTFKLFIGLDWERCLIEKWLSINLRLGYESQYFWSQIFNDIRDITTAGDLTFEGFTFSGRLDF